MKSETMNKKLPTQKFINDLLHEMIIDIIDENIPYKWIDDECPWDCSGEVELCSKKDLKEIKKNAIDEISFCCESFFDHFLHSIYVNRWEATYVSGMGKRWITYGSILHDDFEEWLYQSFEIFDEDGEYMDDGEEIYYKLQDMYTSFIKDNLKTNHRINIYFKKILAKIE